MSFGKIESVTIDDVVVSKSLLLEACSRIASSCIDRGVDLTIAKKFMVQLRPHAETLLITHPNSIWTVKGVAAFVDTMKLCDMILSDSPNEIFEALIPNLRKKNHFLRLHLLEILRAIRNDLLSRTMLRLIGQTTWTRSHHMFRKILR